MKKQIVVLCLLNMIFSVCAYSQSEPSKPKSEKWFRLEPNNVYVEDLLLKPGETKEIEISTEEPLSVGLQTDASLDLKKGKKYVRLTQKGTEYSIGTLIGASRVFNPTGGKLTLSVKNETDAALRVVIFKKLKK